MDASSGFSTPPTGGATGPTSLRGSLGSTAEYFSQPGTSQTDAFRLIERARAGVPMKEVSTLIAELALTNAEAARLLGLKTRELTSLLNRGVPLLPVEDGAVHLLLLRELSVWGTAIFADQGKFNRWLRRPLPVLEGQTPLSLLDTDTGLQLVREELGRLAHGVYC